MKHLLILLFLLPVLAFGQSPFHNDVVRANNPAPAKIANALDVSKPLTSSGTNTYTFSVPFTGFTYHTGDIYTFVFGNTNSSGTVTADIGSLGALAIKDAEGNNLSVGALKAGGAYKFYYNGTHLRLIGGTGSGTGGGATAAGSTGDVQYKSNGGGLQAEAALHYDSATNTLTVANIAASVALAGNPTTTTQSANDNSTRIATTAYADAVVVAATETTAGKAELATQSETDTGTDDERIVTPLKLNTWGKLKAIVLEADDTNNNVSANTLEDVQDFKFPVENGGIYYFKFIIDFTSAATTTGTRWTINGPTNSRLNYDIRFDIVAGSSKTESMQSYNTTYDQATVSGNGPLVGQASIEGFVTVTADGFIQCRFASEVSSSAVTAKAGSIVLYMRLN